MSNRERSFLEEITQALPEWNASADEQERWRTVRSLGTKAGPVEPAERKLAAELLGPFQQHYPDAPALALHWLGRLPEAAQAAAQTRPGRDPLPVMMTFVRLDPPAGAADALAQAVQSLLDELNRPFPSFGLNEADRLRHLVRLLAHLDAADPARPWVRGEALLRLLIDRPGQGGANSYIHTLGGAILGEFGPPLVETGRLDEPSLDALLRELGDPFRGLQADQFIQSEAWDAACDRAMGRFLERALAGQPEVNLLWSYPRFRGFGHFLAACRMLEQFPLEKFRLSPETPQDEPIAWVVRLLRRLPAPDPADLRRAGELEGIAPAALEVATLLAPDWAPLADACLNWPGRGQLVSWIAAFASKHTWGSAGDEEAAGPGPINRVALLGAVQAMGIDRAIRILKHWIPRKIYWDGVFYAEAVLGRNAADVEAKFLKRTRQAVIALGMLPDEDDILQRYLALRKFERESRRASTPQHARDLDAAERGLANLAATAGFLDRIQLEWSMEARLVNELPPDCRWEWNGYVIALEAGADPVIAVQRGGKPLKTIPAALRQAPVFTEIKEFQERLADQWERIHKRLELAMVLAEVFNRDSFAPALETPSGRAVLPCLVLRCWLAGSDEPLELLNFRSLTGDAVPLDRIDRFQVAHPLQLREAGTLAAWQKALVDGGFAAPFNQLFREIYLPTAREMETKTSTRFAGRLFRVGPLVVRLKSRGWDRTYGGSMQRRLPGNEIASFEIATKHGLFESGGIHPMGELHLPGRYATASPQPSTQLVSELLRDVDWATREAAPPEAPAELSPEALEARQAIVRMRFPALNMAGTWVQGPNWRVHLGTGVALQANDDPLALGDLPTLEAFLIRNPDSGLLDVFSRIDYLNRRRS